MDPNCLLTSTDLETRRARCQHQLSFLLSHVSILSRDTDTKFLLVSYSKFTINLVMHGK